MMLIEKETANDLNRTPSKRIVKIGSYVKPESWLEGRQSRSFEYCRVAGTICACPEHKP